jgi:hypothetical protein
MVTAREISRQEAANQDSESCDGLLHGMRSDDYCGYDPYYADEDHELARRVIHRSIEHLYLRNKGRFVYRLGRYFQ